MSRLQVPNDLAAEFVALNDYLRAGGERSTALQRLVGLAVNSVPSCDWATIIAWPRGKQPRSLASSGQTGEAVDQLQYDLGEGPCLTGAAESQIVHIPDIAHEDRWPKFTAAVQSQTPVRGVLSCHLLDEPERSALNLYSTRPGEFDTAALSIAALFAAHAHVLLTHAASTDKAANLEHALNTSRQIGAAIGILMNTHKITYEQAFGLLRASSQHLHRKLNDIADDVNQTGTLPEQT